MTDPEILRVWNTLSKQTYTEARVFSCVVSAYENNNGEIDTGRAGAVMQVVWPQTTALGGVPSEIRGTTANQTNNRNRQADFTRLMQLIHLSTGRETSSQISPVQEGSSTPQVTIGGPAAQAGAGFGDPVENIQVETVAVQAVVKHYKEDGWSVRSVERDKCGYDLECAKGTVVEQVEVKGISGTGLCFVITASEVKQARENPKFVLVVVTSTLSASPSLTKFSGVEFGQRFDLAAIQYRASLKR